MIAADRYDGVIVGTGAGGGTREIRFRHKLRPTDHASAERDAHATTLDNGVGPMATPTLAWQPAQEMAGCHKTGWTSDLNSIAEQQV